MYVELRYTLLSRKIERMHAELEQEMDWASMAEAEGVRLRAAGWRRSKPTEEGVYLRSNPPIDRIVRQDVVEVDGKLKTPHGPETVLVCLDDISNRFWWYGPIPQPPWKLEAAEAKQVQGSVE